MAIAPEWVSKSFLECTLRKYFQNENIEVLEYTTSAAIPVGENYTSDLLRIWIKYTARQNETENVLSLIIKCCPNNKMLLDYAQTMKLFEQEADVYTEVFPAISKITGIISENTTEYTKSLSAKCIHFVKNPQLSIILEDLTALGFKMHPRQHGLDLQHCLLVIGKLAYFHATTVVIHDKDPSLINKYNLGIFWENYFTVRWIKTGFAALTEACAKWPGYEKYSNKLKQIKGEVIHRSFMAAKRKSGDLNVLNHGDAWINNFMFLYEPDGTPKDVRFVDFQVPVHSSPALDLNFFWATSPNIDVRKQHFGRVMDSYYTKFTDTLDTLKYSSEDIPSRELFLKEFNSRAFYGLTAAITVLPLVTATKREDATFDDLFANNQDDDGFKYDAYNNIRYRSCMEYLLPFYDKLGILD